MILIKVENLFLGDCIIEAALNRDFSGFYRTGLTSFGAAVFAAFAGSITEATCIIK
jgi:hypothetical protein